MMVETCFMTLGEGIMWSIMMFILGYVVGNYKIKERKI